LHPCGTIIIRAAAGVAARPAARYESSMMIRPVLAVFLLLAVGLPARAATHAVRNTDTEGEGSLREAVDDASKGDTIVFGSSVRGTIALAEPLTIDGLNLKGAGAEALTVRGSGEATLKLDNTVTISGLTIAGGDTTIAVANGKVTLLDSAVIDSRGAGIKLEDGRLTLVRSQISGNAGAGSRTPAPCSASIRPWPTTAAPASGATTARSSPRAAPLPTTAVPASRPAPAGQPCTIRSSPTTSAVATER
jgi:hypothetical protein